MEKVNPYYLFLAIWSIQVTSWSSDSRLTSWSWSDLSSKKKEEDDERSCDLILWTRRKKKIRKDLAIWFLLVKFGFFFVFMFVKSGFCWTCVFFVKSFFSSLSFLIFQFLGFWVLCERTFDEFIMKYCFIVLVLKSRVWDIIYTLIFFLFFVGSIVCNYQEEPIISGCCFSAADFEGWYILINQFCVV